MPNIDEIVTKLEQFCKQASRQDYYRALRDPDRSDVMDTFFAMMSKDSPIVNAKTGQRHTVESMVGELRERVGLESYLNRIVAKNDRIELSRRAAQKINLDEITDEAKLKEFLGQFSLRFLNRDSGLTPAENIIEALKGVPGGLDLITKFTREKIKEVVQMIVDAHPKSDPSSSLPSYDGGALPAADHSHTQESVNIGMGGSPGITGR